VIHRGLVDDEEDLIQKNAIVSYIGGLLNYFLSFSFYLKEKKSDPDPALIWLSWIRITLMRFRIRIQIQLPKRSRSWAFVVLICLVFIGFY
jgi:hypothetical protein